MGVRTPRALLGALPAGVRSPSKCHLTWRLSTRFGSGPAPSVTLRSPVAGWSSSVARWAHNPEVAGSNPVPATKWNGPRRKLRGPFSWCGNSVEAGHARRLALQNSPAHLDLSVGRAGATGETVKPGVADIHVPVDVRFHTRTADGQGLSGTPHLAAHAQRVASGLGGAG